MKTKSKLITGGFVFLIISVAMFPEYPIPAIFLGIFSIIAIIGGLKKK